MEGYELAKCGKCGMVWDPFPHGDLKSVYGKNYFINENPKGGYANYFEGMKINKKTFYERIKRIERKMAKKGKMLDLGSALGDSLIAAKKLGWKEIMGVELSEFATKEARKKGLDVKIGTLKSSRFPQNHFDVVTIQDVIEHVEDPVSELKNVQKVLKPGGYAFIVTPDVSGFWSKILGSLWYHYKPGEHIMYFSQKSLKKALEVSGFKNIKTGKTYHVMSLEYIFNRLRYYSSGLFGFLLRLSKRSSVGRMSFRIYAGEIEAWGQK